MSDQSPLLGLPYIQPSQAQKHVTHNEALQLLDALVQPAVLSRALAAAPALPAAGDRYIVAAGATGSWTGQSGKIALWDGTAWLFLAPRAGWCCHVEAEAALATYSGSAWLTPAQTAQSFAQLGVNTAPDPLNPLTVSGAATLFNHAGAGHQVKVNKATAAATASLLFQTGYSGRAEMGLAGSDDFAIKVSANGSSFATALAANRSTGQVSLPAGAALAEGSASAPGLVFANDADTGAFHPAADQIGLATAGVQRALLTTSALQLDLPLTGTAVMSGLTDTTAGRLVKVGAFGLGATATPDASADASGLATGFFRATSGTVPAAGGNWHILHMSRLPDAQSGQLGIADSSAGLAAVRGRNSAGVWGAWNTLYGRTNLLGTVSQASGVPTGAVIERGSNANGEYIRFADGTQICWFDAYINQSLAANTYTETTWTYPAAFVSGSLPAPRAHSRCTSTAADRENAARYTRSVGTHNSNTSGSVGIVNTSGSSLSVRVDVMAIGRWF